MSNVTSAIQNYRDGKTTWQHLFTFLTTRKWPEPERFKDLPTDPLEREAELDRRPDYTDGTWDELLRAKNTGLLSEPEYNAVNEAMWRMHGQPKATTGAS